MPPPAQPIAPDASLRSAAIDAPVTACESAEGGPAESQRPEQQNVEASPEPQIEAQEGTSPREPTLADLPRLESLTLSDFVGNYEHVTVLEDRTATEGEIQEAVEEFLAGLNVGREQ